MIFYQETTEAVIHHLASDINTGLTDEQVESRLLEYGENRLQEKKKKSNFPTTTTTTKKPILPTFTDFILDFLILYFYILDKNGSLKKNK